MRDKYSAFVTEVSEILGLGKPVDILKLCATTDLFFKPLEEHIKELEKENVELKEKRDEIFEAFASASSGDDFEMAESAREIMEILDIPCYRHGKVVSKFTKAKEIIKRLINACCAYGATGRATADAEQFLKEVSK